MSAQTVPALFVAARDPVDLLPLIDRLRQDERTLQAWTAYPVPDIRRAIDSRPSRLPLVAGCVGLAGAAGAYCFQWWMTADYPLHIGAIAIDNPIPFIPITFESGILSASLCAVLGLLVLLRLPHLHATADEERFQRLVADGWGVLVVRGERLERIDSEALQALGAARIQLGRAYA